MIPIRPRAARVESGWPPWNSRRRHKGGVVPAHEKWPVYAAEIGHSFVDVLETQGTIALRDILARVHENARQR
jgi:hypothetical protein